MNMSLFNDLMHAAAANGTGAQMLASAVIKGTLLLGFFALLTLALRRASASTRHQLWALGLIGIMLLPLMSAGLPTWGILNLPPSAPAQKSSQFSPPAVDRTSQPVTSTALASPDLSPDKSRARAMSGTGQSKTDAAATSLLSNLSSMSAVTWISILWVAGALLLMGSIFWAIARLRHLESRAKIITDAAWTGMLLSLCNELSVPRRPVLMQSHKNLTPMTWGLRRPRILLPASCGRWTPDQSRQILLHELAHVKRRDCLVHFIVQIACLVYWFNPLVWLAARQMRVERERACDDLVLISGAKASSYASNLLDIASSLASEKRALAYSLAMARRSQISGRLLAVLDPKRSRLAPNRYRTVTAVALTLTLALPLAVAGPVSQAKDKKERTSVMMVDDSGSTPYKVNWEGEIKLTEDGRGIKWMADDSYLKIEQKIDGKWRKVEIEPDDDGNPVYSYKIGRRKKPFDGEAAGWLGDMLEEICIDGELVVPEMPDLPDLPDLPTLPELPELPSISSLGSLNMLHDDSHTQITWENDDGSTLKLEMEGEIELNEDDSGILRMEDGAYFKLEEKKGRKKIKVEAEPDRRGNPVYIYNVGGKEQPFDDEAAEWLSGVLANTIPEIAVNADIRVQRAYEKGGTSSVIELLDGIDSGYSKSRHYQEYFALTGLHDDEVADVLEHMGRDLDSDYELASVLVKNLKIFQASDRTRNAFLACVSSIDSDYETARVIKTALDEKNLPAGTVTVLLAAAGDIDSDYETARVLAAVDPGLLSDDTVRAAYFEVLKDIDSDYEKGRVLSSLSKHAKKNDTLRRACLEAAETIDSEYEYGRVIKSLR